MKRFWDKVKIAGPDECWEWQAGFKKPSWPGDTHLYGRIQFNGKAVYAHRMSWLLTNGEIPDGMFICHHCDNPKCVNPNHLFLGTSKDNMDDMWAKGRRVALATTHCPHGHEWNEKNTYWQPNKKWRQCKECRNINAKRYRNRKKELNVK